jgi:serine/threonine protein kinase
VRCLHHDIHGARPYLALEKLPGTTVEHLTDGGAALTPTRLVDLGMGLATTLHYMRYADVVHLDVMPRNVLFHDRIPHLIDFDLARNAKQAASLTWPTGSPRCRAPEQCDPPATGRAGYASDVWGLGVTLHMAASAAFPFRPGSTGEGADIHLRFPQLVDEADALPPEVPRGLAEVIQACMLKDPIDRPTPTDVYFALEALSKEGSTSVRPIRTSVPPASGGDDSDQSDRARFDMAMKAKTSRRPPRRR